MFQIPLEEEISNIQISGNSLDTKPTVIQFNYTWVIKYFCLDTKYESPVFSLVDYKNLKWYLKLITDSDNIEPSLCLLPCVVSNMTVKCTFTLSSDNDAGNSPPMMIPPTLKTISPTEIAEYGAENSFSCPNISSHCPRTGRRIFAGADLTIFCAIDLFMDAPNVPEYRRYRSAALMIMNEPQNHPSDIVQYLLNDEKYSDITINVGGQKFPAHKAILAARSPVFSAMFEHEMKEKEKNEVDVTDVEPEVFRELLVYIYTGQVPNIDKIADKFLMAAEKYDLEEVKFKCAVELRASITIENSADILILADIFNLEQLKTFAAVFINFNLAEVLETEGFQSMSKSHPMLTLDVLRAVTETKRCGTE